MKAYINSNFVIYYVEQHPQWFQKTAARFVALRGQGALLVVSDLTRMECQVGPLKTNDTPALQLFANFFQAPDVIVVSVTASVFDRAAQIRASYGFKPLDSIHLAAAIEHGCSLFLTKDHQLRRCTDITVEILS